MRVSLCDAPCCDMEAIKGGGGGGLKSFFCLAAAGASNRNELNNARFVSSLRLGGRFDVKASVLDRRVEASSHSCTMEGDHGLLVHGIYHRTFDVPQLSYSNSLDHLQTLRKIGALKVCAWV
jgi:hypothetical protein